MSGSRVLLVLTLLVALWAGAMGAWAETEPKRVALVIGNSDYSAVPRLLNPQNDAMDIAA